MVIHGHDPIPLMSEGGIQSNLGSYQPMLHPPIEIAGNAKGVDLPTTPHGNVLAGDASAVASDEKRMDASAVNENASSQKQLSFDSKLSDLERMLLLRRKLNPDSPEAFDDIIRTQILTLVPAFDMGNRESSIARYVKRLAGIRMYILSQWKSKDHNGWNGDCDHSIKFIDQMMAGLMRTIDVQSNSGLERDLDPLTALESLSDIKGDLFDKHGLEKNVDALIEQRIRALSLAQHSQIQASRSCPRVDAFDRGRAEAMKVHGASNDRTADLQMQVADLVKNSEQANEKMPQVQLEHLMNLGILASNADAWATPTTSSVLCRCPPSISNPSVPGAVRFPVEASNYGPPITNLRPRDVATSSFPQLVSYAPSMGPGYAVPSELFRSPIINPVDQRHHDHGNHGHGLGCDERNSLGPFNTGSWSMGTQMPPPPLNLPPTGGFPVEQTGTIPSKNTNVWPASTSMPPNMTTQAFIETQKQLREASIDQSRGQHSLTRANHGSRRYGGLHNGCEHHERGNRGFRRGRAYHGRDSRDKADWEGDY